MTEFQGKEKTIQSRGEWIKFKPPVLSRNISSMPPEELPVSASIIHGWIADYCGYLAEILYMDSTLQDQLFTRLQEARMNIDRAKEPEALKVALNDAIFQVHRIHVSIAQGQELSYQKVRMQWISPILVLLYILIIIGIIILTPGLDESLKIPVIGIPVSVLIWSLLGSVAAILYRFYNFQLTKLMQVSPQVSWLIARPLTGVIMGMVSYVAIIAGLFIFSGDTPTTLGIPAIRPQLLWLVAFLAGFSDQFHEGFIHAIIDKLTKPTPKKTEDNAKKAKE
jgi:hypothetical protein